jgi:type III secretion system YscD/HrpQ family protein
MENEQKKYTLKIYTGVHAGAEIPIDDGRYVIGRDDECDIVLADKDISPRHTSIAISNGNLHIAAMDDTVYLEGSMIADGEISFDLYNTVTIGSTHFALGLAGHPWPSVQLPMLEPVHPTPEGPVEQQKDLTGESAVAEMDSKKGARPILLFFIFAVLLLISIFVLLFFLSRKPDYRPSPVPQGVRIKNLESVIARNNFGNLKIIPDSNGAITVQGYVETTDQKNHITNALREEDPVVIIKVRSTQRLAQITRDLLKTLGHDLQVQTSGNGKITISGYVEKQADWDQIQEFIRQDIPALKGIGNRVMTQNDLIAVLRGLIREAGLDEKIRLKGSPGTITASGNPDARDLVKWTTLKNTFLEHYGKFVTIKDAVQAVAAAVVVPQVKTETGPIELRIKGVSMGRLRFVTLSDGTRCFEGGFLKNGIQIKSIRKDRIILRKDGQDHNFYLGGN